MKMLVLYYLRFFAQLALSIHKPKVIGITGSVGKSSTSKAVFAMMKDHFKVKLIKEGNSETGIPLGILELDPGHYQLSDWFRIIFAAPFNINHLKNTEYLIVEMGIDSPHPPKNMDYLLTIVKPDISVVLNVYPVHTMQFDELFQQEDLSDEKRREYILKRITKEKLKIITKSKPKVGIFNKSILFHPSSAVGTKLISFGESNENEIKYLDYQVNLKKTVFKYLLISENKQIIIEINNFVLPKAYFEVFAATIAIGISLGMKEEQIVSGITNNFTIPAGRGSLFEGINSSIIIDSSYNSSKASMATFLEMAETLSEKENRPLVVVMGDMRELGKEAKIEHEQIADIINKIKIKHFFCLGPNTKKYIVPKLIGSIETIRHFKTAIEVGEFLHKTLPYRAIVLVKGSQNEIFLEEAVKKILKNKSDSSKLCRQNDFWLKKKSEYFSTF